MFTIRKPWAAMAAAFAVLACNSPPSAGVAAVPGELQGDHLPTTSSDVVIHPINHATFAFQWDGKTYYVDPVGGPEVYQGLPKADVVLITDIHQDHFSPDTLKLLYQGGVFVVPQAVYDKMPEAMKSHAAVLANGQSRMVAGVNFEAIPMYNTTADRLQYHTKGRGNGYVVTAGGKRIYIAGDTEDIPEMRALKDIDVAFLPMNLPYTMTVQQAADAVRAFKPKVVYPYHYRGSDVEEFKKLVGTNAGVEVRLRNWY